MINLETEKQPENEARSVNANYLATVGQVCFLGLVLLHYLTSFQTLHVSTGGTSFERYSIATPFYTVGSHLSKLQLSESSLVRTTPNDVHKYFAVNKMESYVLCIQLVLFYLTEYFSYLNSSRSRHVQISDFLKYFKCGVNNANLLLWKFSATTTTG